MRKRIVETRSGLGFVVREASDVPFNPKDPEHVAAPRGQERISPPKGWVSDYVKKQLSSKKAKREIAAAYRNAAKDGEDAQKQAEIAKRRELRDYYRGQASAAYQAEVVQTTQSDVRPAAMGPQLTSEPRHVRRKLTGPGDSGELVDKPYERAVAGAKAEAKKRGDEAAEAVKAKGGDEYEQADARKDAYHQAYQPAFDKLYSEYTKEARGVPSEVSPEIPDYAQSMIGRRYREYGKGDIGRAVNARMPDREPERSPQIIDWSAVDIKAHLKKLIAADASGISRQYRDEIADVEAMVDPEEWANDAKAEAEAAGGDDQEQELAWNKAYEQALEFIDKNRQQSQRQKTVVETTPEFLYPLFTYKDNPKDTIEIYKLFYALLTSDDPDKIVKFKTNEYLKTLSDFYISKQDTEQPKGDEIEGLKSAVQHMKPGIPFPVATLKRFFGNDRDATISGLMKLQSIGIVKEKKSGVFVLVPQRAEIVTVVPDSSAAKSGMRDGDRLAFLPGVETTVSTKQQADALYARMKKMFASGMTEITLNRGGKSVDIVFDPSKGTELGFMLGVPDVSKIIDQDFTLGNATDDWWPRHAPKVLLKWGEKPDEVVKKFELNDQEIEADIVSRIKNLAKQPTVKEVGSEAAWIKAENATDTHKSLNDQDNKNVFELFFKQGMFEQLSSGVNPNHPDSADASAAKEAALEKAGMLFDEQSIAKIGGSPVRGQASEIGGAEGLKVNLTPYKVLIDKVMGLHNIDSIDEKRDRFNEYADGFMKYLDRFSTTNAAEFAYLKKYEALRNKVSDAILLTNGKDYADKYRMLKDTKNEAIGKLVGLYNLHGDNYGESADTAAKIGELQSKIGRDEQIIADTQSLIETCKEQIDNINANIDEYRQQNKGTIPQEMAHKDDLAFLRDQIDVHRATIASMVTLVAEQKEYVEQLQNTYKEYVAANASLKNLSTIASSDINPENYATAMDTLSILLQQFIGMSQEISEKMPNVKIIIDASEAFNAPPALHFNEETGEVEPYRTIDNLSLFKAIDPDSTSEPESELEAEPESVPDMETRLKKKDEQRKVTSAERLYSEIAGLDLKIGQATANKEDIADLNAQRESRLRALQKLFGNQDVEQVVASFKTKDALVKKYRESKLTNDKLLHIKNEIFALNKIMEAINSRYSDGGDYDSRDRDRINDIQKKQREYKQQLAAHEMAVGKEEIIGHGGIDRESLKHKIGLLDKELGQDRFTRSLAAALDQRGPVREFFHDLRAQQFQKSLAYTVMPMKKAYKTIIENRILGLLALMDLMRDALTNKDDTIFDKESGNELNPLDAVLQALDASKKHRSDDKEFTIDKRALSSILALKAGGDFAARRAKSFERTRSSPIARLRDVGVNNLADLFNFLGQNKFVAVGTTARTAENWQRNGYLQSLIKYQEDIRKKLVKMLDKLYGIGQWGNAFKELGIDYELIMPKEAREADQLALTPSKKAKAAAAKAKATKSPNADEQLLDSKGYVALGTISDLLAKSIEKHAKLENDLKEIGSFAIPDSKLYDVWNKPFQLFENLRAPRVYWASVTAMEGFIKEINEQRNVHVDYETLKRIEELEDDKETLQEQIGELNNDIATIFSRRAIIGTDELVALIAQKDTLLEQVENNYLLIQQLENNKEDASLKHEIDVELKSRIGKINDTLGEGATISRADIEAITSLDRDRRQNKAKINDINKELKSMNISILDKIGDTDVGQRYLLAKAASRRIKSLENKRKSIEKSLVPLEDDGTPGRALRIKTLKRDIKYLMGGNEFWRPYELDDDGVQVWSELASMKDLRTYGMYEDQGSKPGAKKWLAPTSFGEVGGLSTGHRVLSSKDIKLLTANRIVGAIIDQFAQIITNIIMYLSGNGVFVPHGDGFKSTRAKRVALTNVPRAIGSGRTHINVARAMELYSWAPNAEEQFSKYFESPAEPVKHAAADKLINMGSLLLSSKLASDAAISGMNRSQYARFRKAENAKRMKQAEKEGKSPDTIEDIGPKENFDNRAKSWEALIKAAMKRETTIINNPNTIDGNNIDQYGYGVLDSVKAKLNNERNQLSQKREFGNKTHGMWAGKEEAMAEIDKAIETVNQKIAHINTMIKLKEQRAKKGVMESIVKGDLIYIDGVSDAPFLNGLRGYVSKVNNRAKTIIVELFNNDVVADKSVLLKLNEAVVYCKNNPISEIKLFGGLLDKIKQRFGSATPAAPQSGVKLIADLYTGVVNAGAAELRKAATSIIKNRYRFTGVPTTGIWHGLAASQWKLLQPHLDQKTLLDMSNGNIKGLIDKIKAEIKSETTLQRRLQ